MRSRFPANLLGRVPVAWRSREVIVQCCRATRKRNQASRVMTSPAAARDALPRVAGDLPVRILVTAGLIDAASTSMQPFIALPSSACWRSVVEKAVDLRVLVFTHCGTFNKYLWAADGKT